MNYDDFFKRGYTKDHYDNIENLLFFDSFVFPHAEVVDEVPKGAEEKLLEIANDLTERYMKKIFKNPKLTRVNMWQGVDSKSDVWHNDHYDLMKMKIETEFRNWNANILLYLDQNNKDLGNAIEFKNQYEEYIEYPDRGDFVVMNTDQKFQHRATHIPYTQRRLLCFDYIISELEN